MAILGAVAWLFLAYDVATVAPGHDGLREIPVGSRILITAPSENLQAGDVVLLKVPGDAPARWRGRLVMGSVAAGPGQEWTLERTPDGLLFRCGGRELVVRPAGADALPEHGRRLWPAEIPASGDAPARTGGRVPSGHVLVLNTDPAGAVPDSRDFGPVPRDLIEREVIGVLPF